MTNTTIIMDSNGKELEEQQELREPIAPNGPTATTTTNAANTVDDVVNDDASPFSHDSHDKALRGRLDDARPLGWTRAASSNARALIDELTGLIIHSEQRGNSRGPAGRAKLYKAVEHLMGGLLRRGLDGNRMAYRSMTKATAPGKAAFPASGGVSYDQLFAASEGLQRLGFLTVYSGYNFRDKGDGAFPFEGRVTRFDVCPSLIELAARHGVIASTVMEDFSRFYPVAIAQPQQPVVIRKLKADRKSNINKESLPLPPGEMTSEVTELVLLGNATLARHSFTGCLPPKLYRIFHECYELEGRWYAEGGPEGYTGMTKLERSAIRVDGQPLIEIDVNASHLTLAHGLLGLELPASDLYDGIPGVQRDLAKLVVVSAFGSGKLIARSPNGAGALLADAGLSWREAVKAVCEVYPFLAYAAQELKGTLGLEKLANYGSPEKLLIHCLMAREAVALSRAVAALWHEDIPALPLHDALLVPAGHAQFAQKTMELAFSVNWHIMPRLAVKGTAG